MSENTKKVVEIEKNALSIDGNRIKINGLVVTEYSVPTTLSEEAREMVINDLVGLYSAIKDATTSKVKIGEMVDNIRTHKTLEKLTYTEKGKVKTVTDKITYTALSKMLKYSPTTLKEAYTIYHTIFKPCTDGKPPITEINGYKVEDYNDTQLLQIAYALNNENCKGIEDFNDTIVNPILSVKEIKRQCDKVTGKDKNDKDGKDDKDNKDGKDDKDTPIDKMPLKLFISKLGDLIQARIKATDATKQESIYKDLVDAHKALAKTYLDIDAYEKEMIVVQAANDNKTE